MPISTRALRTSFAKGEEILTRTGKAFRIEAVDNNRIVSGLAGARRLYRLRGIKFG